MSDGNRGHLADFLRSRRARLTPADVGLPADSEPGRRRTPGLRREEVAELSGVGVTWYTWLEQGRKITASPQVVDALARALRLGADEHRHLRELAGLAAAPTASGDDAQARLQRLVDAAEQLGHGVSVVAECVNPLAVTRDAWRDVAAGHSARLVEVELVCTDQAAHRERATTREVDIPGLRLPDWEQITGREYEPWDRGHLVIDTATRTPTEAVAAILAAIPSRPDHVPAGPD